MTKNTLLPLEANKEKTFKKAFQYEFYPNAEQKILLAKTFGSVRFVYNKNLDTFKTLYQNYVKANELYKSGLTNIPPIRPIITDYTLSDNIARIKSISEYEWLYDVSSVALQQTAMDLNCAFSRYFKHLSEKPKFKSKKDKQSFRLVGKVFKVDIEKGILTLPKSKDTIKLRYSRKMPCAPSRVTISKLPCGKYIATFLCEIITKKTQGIGKIGIDLGIKSFIVDSDGNKISNEKFLIKSQSKLKRLQQSLSRKQKGSNNRKKAQIKVAKIHYHIAQQRKDFQHKLSTKLINENQVICLESLRPSNMVKNRKLSKHISDASWSGFKDMLAYKAKHSQHCNVVFIDPFFPSTHICNTTGQKLDYKLKLSERTWKCPHCGEIHDRDLNAAKNIRDEGLYQLAIIDPKNQLSGTCVITSKS